MNKELQAGISTGNSLSPLKLANHAFRQGNFAEAIRLYVQTLQATPALEKAIIANLAMARRKYRASRGSNQRPNVVVCGWELAHSAAGRVYTIAKLYETFAEVEIIGGIYPKHEKVVQEPNHDTTITLHTFIVEDESRFIEQAMELVVARPYDIVHLSKPSAPNIFLGILYKLIWDAKVLINIDEEELALVKNETPISIDEYLKVQGKLPEMKDLLGMDWTRFAIGLVKEFDGVTVSNPALQQHYGGEIIPHTTNEPLDQSSPELKSREKLGIPQNELAVESCAGRLQHLIMTIGSGRTLHPVLAKLVQAQTSVLTALHQSRVIHGLDIATHKPNSVSKINNETPVFRHLITEEYVEQKDCEPTTEEQNWWHSPFSNWENPRPPKQKRLVILSSDKTELMNFGASFLGPVLASFFSNLSNTFKKTNDAPTLNFLAREGYFLELVFKKLIENGLIKKSNSHYLFCSRTLLFKLSLAKPVLWTKLLNHPYKGSLSDFFKDRFAFTQDEVDAITNQSLTLKNNQKLDIDLPANKGLVLSILREANSAIKDIVNPKLELYLQYLEKIGFGKHQYEHVVDLGYAGTIQTLLSDITGVATIGHYFITTKKAKNTKLAVFNGYLLNSINFGDNHALLDRSLYLESLLTAPHGSVVDIELKNEEICFSFGLETTAQKQFLALETIAEGAIDYVLMAIQKNVVMDNIELSEYYGKFVSNGGHFPPATWDLFEIDDTISGFGLINPLYFFNKI